MGRPGDPAGGGGGGAATLIQQLGAGRSRPRLPVPKWLCYPPGLRPRPGRSVSVRASNRDRARSKGSTISRDLRVNQMIRIPQVRVVDEEGAQLGVMPTPQALAMAQERGLDLVEVAPMAAPPVVKFLDFGQYKYELTKREKEAKRKQRSVTFKEVRLKPKIGMGDFDTKVRRAIEFLEEGDRIKVAVQFRGRELTHPEIGRSPPDPVRGADQGSRRRRAGAAPRRQVDAHHGGLDPQAEGRSSIRRRHGAESDEAEPSTATEAPAAVVPRRRRGARPRPRPRRRRPPSRPVTPASEAGRGGEAG